MKRRRKQGGGESRLEIASVELGIASDTVGNFEKSSQRDWQCSPVIDKLIIPMDVQRNGKINIRNYFYVKKTCWSSSFGVVLHWEFDK